MLRVFNYSCKECNDPEFWKLYIWYIFRFIWTFLLCYIQEELELLVSLTSEIPQSLLHFPETLNPVAFLQFVTLPRMYELLKLFYIIYATWVIHTFCYFSARTIHDDILIRLSPTYWRRNIICVTHKLSIRFC